MKDSIIFFFIFTSVFAFFLLDTNQNQINTQLQTINQLNHKLEFKDSYINVLEAEAKQKDTLIIELYKPIVRLQLIAGIKNPDTTFTYLEKTVNPVNVKALVKADLR